MSIIISKIISHSDNPDCYLEMTMNLDKPVDFAFVAGKMESLFPKDFEKAKKNIRYIEHSLFNQSELTRIVVPVTPNGLYYLILRPRHILSQIIVEPNDVVVDIYYGEHSLIYSFYNPTRRESIVVRGRIAQDEENVYSKIKSNPTDQDFRQDILHQAMGRANERAISQKPIIESDTLNVCEAAKYLRIASSTLYKKTSDKVIPHYKTGKNLFFKKTDLDNYIEENKVKSTKELDEAAIEIVTTINSMRSRKIRKK